MNTAVYNTVSGYGLLDNYKVHYYFDKYTGGASNAHVYSDAASQYSGKIFSYEGGAHASAALDLFTGDLGTGTFSGGLNQFYDYVSIQNYGDLFSGQFSILIGAQTTSRQDLGEQVKGPVSNNNILFSNFSGDDCTYSGWQIGINAANRAYVECYNGFDPLVLTYKGLPNPSVQNIWGLVFTEGSLSLGLYDISTESFSFTSNLGMSVTMEPTSEWRIGSGINFDPNVKFSPQLTLNSGLFAGKMNHFVYFNTGLDTETINTVAKSLYSDLYEKIPPTYTSGDTTFPYSSFSGAEISGLLGTTISCSLTGTETGYVQFDEIREITGTLTGAMTYYLFFSQRDHAISGVVKTYRSLWSSYDAPPITIQHDEGDWVTYTDGGYQKIDGENFDAASLLACWASGDDVTIKWPAIAGTPWSVGISAEIYDIDYGLPGWPTVDLYYRFSTSHGVPSTDYNITVERTELCVVPPTGITGFTTISHQTGIVNYITGCSGTTFSGLLETVSGVTGSNAGGFTGLLTRGVSGISGQPPPFLRPNAFSYIGTRFPYTGVIEKYHVPGLGITTEGALNNLALIGQARYTEGQGFFIKSAINSGSLGSYLNGVGRELGGIEFKSSNTSKVFFNTTLNENFASTAICLSGSPVLLSENTATDEQIKTYFNTYNVISGDYYLEGVDILESLIFSYSNPNILNIYDTGLNTETVRSRMEWPRNPIEYEKTIQHAFGDWGIDSTGLVYNNIQAQIAATGLPTCWVSGANVEITWPVDADFPPGCGGCPVDAEIFNTILVGEVYWIYYRYLTGSGVAPTTYDITVERDQICLSEISGDQWVFFNGQKMVSGINYIDHTTSGFTPLGYITGITGLYFTIPPVDGTTKVTGHGLSFEGSPFFPNSNIIFINGVRQDVGEFYVEHTQTKDLISGKESLKTYGTSMYNNYN